MSPSLLLDDTSNFDLVSKPPSNIPRTLLLAPPSIAAHEEALRNVLSHYDRSVTDLQMLDRLSTGMAKLPQLTYDLVLILSDANGTRSESTKLLDRNIFQQIYKALKAGGRLETQDKSLGQDPTSMDFREAILAGLILEKLGMVKPKYLDGDSVPIKSLRQKVKDLGVSNSGPKIPNGTSELRDYKTTFEEVSHGRLDETSYNDERKKPSIIDFDDDELIDEDTLLTEEEMKRPLNIPVECMPRPGRQRRACKDCTCGLAEKLSAEDAARRSTADAQLRTLKIETDELAEVDFTVYGKVGSCGNCSLGDAFRCVACPYIGMPAFKPGEEVVGDTTEYAYHSAPGILTTQIYTV